MQAIIPRQSRGLTWAEPLLRGALIRTAASGQRVQMTSSALETYDSGGNKRVEIPATADRINFYEGGSLRAAVYGSSSSGVLNIDPGSVVQIGGTGGINLDPNYASVDAQISNPSVLGSLYLDASLGIVLQNNGTSYLKVGQGDGTVQAERPFNCKEVSSGPGSVVSGRGYVYFKASKFVIAYDDAGTDRYFTLDLTNTTPTWSHSTSAP